MKGRVIRDGETIAELSDDLVWIAPADMELTLTLNERLRWADRSPSLGSWIAAHVIAMAEVLEGEAELPVADAEDSVPGRIY